MLVGMLSLCCATTYGNGLQIQYHNNKELISQKNFYNPLDKILQKAYNMVKQKIFGGIRTLKDNTIPENIVRLIVEAVQSAVGDDIREDIVKNRLQTTNSVPSRIWDLINRNLTETLQTQECSVYRASRGPWGMHVVFEPNTKYIVTFMREKRFSQLVKDQRKRKKMHYLDMLADYFNRDLSALYHQLSLFPHEFSDEDRLEEHIQNLLRNLGSNSEIVKNHMLVLFDTSRFELVSVRMVMLTPSLEIAVEEDWSKYISRHESLIVETVDNSNSPAAQPNRGLKLKGRAIERQKNKPKRKQNDDKKDNQA